MLIPAVFFWQIALALHIIFVVVAFGTVVSFPLLASGAERLDRRSVPLILRLRQLIGRGFVNPGLLVVVLAGVYLASELHQWHYFYVQWGVGVAIVLGGLEGAFVIRQCGKLADIAQRDIDASGDGELTWSEEYTSARTRLDQISVAMAVLVIVTVYIMVVQ